MLFSIVVASACSSGSMLGPPLDAGDFEIGEERVFSTHREVDVRWGVTGATLEGTLLLPRQSGQRYPAVVAHFGSDRWTRFGLNGFTRTWLQRGFAILTYDKRGVGESSGECCPWRDPGYFALLAGDVLGAVRAIREHPDIDDDRIGLWGFSQGGWVVPIAAADGAADIAFTIIGSGPTVTVGEEILYSALTGENDCAPSGLSVDEIERRLDEAGPSLFDPRPFLERMTADPGLWIYGSRDASVPVSRSIRALEEITAAGGHDFTIVVLPRANHVWIPGGGICEFEGPTANWVTPTFSWLEDRIGPAP